MRIKRLGISAACTVGLCALAAPALAQNEATWTDVADIKYVSGNYTPLVITGTNSISVYGNSEGHQNTDGNFFLRTGTFTPSQVSKFATEVIHAATQITDQTGSPYIRTTAVVRGPSGTYYAVLHVGDSYPSAYFPAWATSTNGVNWTYHGKFTLTGSYTFAGSSSASLIVQEEKPATIDDTNPMNNRYIVYEDAFCSGGWASCLPKVQLLYSADGLVWHFYRDGNGQIVDMWPNEAAVAADHPIWITTTKTTYGYHLIAGNDWPTSLHRHLWSCDGLHWRVIEIAADTDTGPKGTNIVYEPATNLVHALSSVRHLQLTAQAFSLPACPSTHGCPATFCFGEGGSSNCSPAIGTCSSSDSGLAACQSSCGVQTTCPSGQTVHVSTCPCACLGSSCGTRTALVCE